jgi:hypothetical protein
MLVTLFALHAFHHHRSRRILVDNHLQIINTYFSVERELANEKTATVIQKIIDAVGGGDTNV